MTTPPLRDGLPADWPTCQQLVELVTDYLEEALPPAQRAALDLHLDACDGCRAYLAQLRRTIQLTGRLRSDDVEPAVVDALVGSFRAWRGDVP